MPIEKVYVLSTNHYLPYFNEDEEISVGIHRIAPHEHGMIVFISRPTVETDTPETLEEIKQILLGTPAWFQPLWVMACADECDYINFDSDIEVNQLLQNMQQMNIADPNFVMRSYNLALES